MPLDPKILASQSAGLLSPAGGINLQPDAALKDSLWISPQESPRSENWWHIRSNLVYRDELAAFFPAAVTVPTFNGIINGLGNIRFEDGSNYIGIHTSHATTPTFHVFDGSTITAKTAAAGATSASSSAPWSTVQTLNRYFFSNGLSGIMVWPHDPTTPNTANPAKLITDVTGYTGGGITSLVARYLCAFAGRLISGYTTESGNVKAQRLRWCSDARYYNWDTSAGLGAGAVDLVDTPGRITGLIATYDQLTVFKEDAVILGRESGDPRAPIVFPSWLKIGCATGSSAQAIDPQTIIFMGNDFNVYLLRGGIASPIGDKIRFALSTTININRLRQVVSWTRPELSLYFLSIPRLGEDFPRFTYVYNWAENLWFNDLYGTEIHSSTLSDVGATVTWDTASGTWDAGSTGAVTWDSLTPVATKQIPVIGVPFDPSTWRVHRFQPPSSGSDLAATPIPISCVWQSKDTRLNPDGRASFSGLFVDIEANGSGVLALTLFSDRSTTNGVTFYRSYSSGISRLSFYPLRVSAKLHSLRLSTASQTSVHIRSIEPIIQLRPSSYPILRGVTT